LARRRRREPPAAANTVVQVKVRLAEWLRRRLEREAARAGHSMNAEVTQRLERSFYITDDQIDVIARSLIDTLDSGVIDRIVDLVHEDDLASNYDQRDESSREGDDR
jgi:hypothetical protein